MRVADDIFRLRERALACEDETEPWERGVIATEVWRDQTNLPMTRKRAEIVARCLEEIPPRLLPEDAFAGIVGRRRRVHTGISDADAWRNPAWNPEAYDYDPGWPLPEHVREVYEWWSAEGRKQSPVPNAVRAENLWLDRYGIAHPHGQITGHTLPGHSILLKAGIPGLRAQVADRLGRHTTGSQRDLLLGIDRILEGMQAHCRRCGDVARKQGKTMVAEVCGALARRPPATLHEAMQLVFFSNCADILDNRGDASSLGRIDQILRPFYEADIAAGRLDDSGAFDLVCRFLAKKYGRQSSNNMTVGGLLADGTDGANPLSHMFLEAMVRTGITVDLTARVHHGSTDAFMELAAQAMRCGLGRGNIYNDDVVIAGLVAKGIEIEDARDYAPLGCVEVMIPGRTSCRTMGFNLNSMKVLELVLNAGRCLVTGKVVWGDVPITYDSFEDLLAEYRRRITDIVDLGVRIIHEDERNEATVHPRAWLTALSRGGIDDAVDMGAGQPKYNPVGVTHMGVADVANSLYAVKRLVFEDKRLALDELGAILRGNWEGHDILRTEVIETFPRFGQASDEINAIARDEVEWFAECFERHETYYGDRFWPMIFGVSTGVIHNKSPKTGATPSGRRLGETLAHSLQPSHAGPRGCITDVLRASACFDGRKFPGGISNVQDCDPIVVAGSQGLDRLVRLLRGFVEMGGVELGMNFIGIDQLRAAQADPDAHRNLMVRLFGMSAHFVSLSSRVQESVIERTAAAQS